jgi:hypothetical protein
LNFGATDSFTILAVVRQWTTSRSYGKYISKRVSPSAGYSLETDATSIKTGFAVSDGTNVPYNVGLPAYTAGTLVTVTGVRSVASDTLIMYNGTASASTTDTTTGASSNIRTLAIGSDTASGFQDFELVGAAVFRTVLTAKNITDINNYFQGRD